MILNRWSLMPDQQDSRLWRGENGDGGGQETQRSMKKLMQEKNKIADIFFP